MKHVRIALVVALLLATLGTAAFAQADAPMTERELTKFLADWPATSQWLEARGKSVGSSQAGQVISAFALESDFAAFLRGKGWTVERYSYVAGTAFALATYVAFEMQNPDVIREFDNAIAEAKARTDIPADEKRQFIENLEDAKKSMLSLSMDLDINPAELKLVRAKYDAIAKIIAASD